jgi:hypothetical protein
MRVKLMAVLIALFVVCFGIFWIFMANSMGAPWYFILFGVLFVAVSIFTLFRALSLRRMM